MIEYYTSSGPVSRHPAEQNLSFDRPTAEVTALPDFLLFLHRNAQGLQQFSGLPLPLIDVSSGHRLTLFLREVTARGFQNLTDLVTQPDRRWKGWVRCQILLDVHKVRGVGVLGVHGRNVPRQLPDIK